MCYGENGTVKFLKTLADNALRHTANYSMMQIKKKLNSGKNFGLHLFLIEKGYFGFILIHFIVLLLNNYEISSI
jgi:hypothetical protein